VLLIDDPTAAMPMVIGICGDGAILPPMVVV
jgi:hypothetical protein